MRTIKFRGKRINDDKWIYGNLANYSSNFHSFNINKLVIFENIASFATDNFVFVVNDCEVAHDTVDSSQECSIGTAKRFMREILYNLTM